MTKGCLVALVVVLVAVPAAVFGQATSPAGVVTVLEGNVTARRVALPDPVPLKFKDDVFFRDTVTTGDKSLARMLLGGRAVVTVRERSVLTITDIPATGRATIELESGKFALAVAREKMRSGEEIQIRTPNAVAGVRGTVVITEVERQGAQTTTGVPAVVTNFHVLRGDITAQLLDAARNPLGTPFPVGTLQTFSAAGLAAPRVQPVASDQIPRIISGLQPTGQKRGGETGKEQVKSQQQQQAAALASAITGDQAAFATTPVYGAPVYTYSGNPVIAPIIPDYSSCVTNASCPDLASALKPNFASFDTDFTSTDSNPLFAFKGQFLNTEGSFFKVESTGNVSLGGGLAQFTDSFAFTGGSLLDIQGGKVKSSGAAALLALDPTFIFATQSLIQMNGGSLTLAAPLLTDTDGVLFTGKAFLELTNGASLTDSGTGALVQLNGTLVGATSALSMTNSTMSLAGPLTTLSDITTLTSASDHMFLIDNSTLTSTGTGALVQLASLGDFGSDRAVFRIMNGSTVTLAGPLLSASASALFSGDPAANTISFASIIDGSQVKSTSTSPFMSFTDSSVDTSGNVFTLRRSGSSTPTRLTLNGPLFWATSSTFDHTSLGNFNTFGVAGACCSAFFVGQGSQLTSTTNTPLIQLTNSTFNGSDSQSGGHFVHVSDTFPGAPASELVAPSSMSLAGPLLSATGSTINALFDLVLARRSGITSTTTSPLVSLTGGTVALGGTNVIDGSTANGRAFHVFSADTSGGSASAGSVSLAGPFISMTGGASLNANSDFIGIFNGGTVTSTSTNPFVSLNGSSVTASTLARVAGTGGASGTSPASMNIGGTLLSVSNGGTFNANDATLPALLLSGGSHSIANTSGTPLFQLTGRAGNVATEAPTSATLSLGTDQPLRHTGSGAFLQLNGATLNTSQAVALDTALLSASAPLLNVQRSGTTGSSLTTLTDGIDLVKNAKLTTTGSLFRVDGSVLTIANGSAVSVRGGSFLNVGGDLFSITNGGQLKILNGGALFVNGGSVVTINGALFAFGQASGNTVTITSTTSCGTSCVSAGGVNFLATNGATVSIINGFKNIGNNTVNIGITTPAVIADGPNTKVTIGGN